MAILPETKAGATVINRPIKPGEMVWLLDKDGADHVSQYSLLHRKVSKEYASRLFVEGDDERILPKSWFFETRREALEEWKRMTEAEIAELERHDLFLTNELWRTK